MRSTCAVLGWTTILLGTAVPAIAWQVHVGPGYGEDSAQAVAFLPDGDVVAGGITERSGDQGVAIVVRLTRSGHLAWRTLIEPRGSQVRALVVDGRGDVVVGALVGGTDESDLGLLTVVKLDGRTGTERWRYDSTGFRGTVVVDGHDDVVVGRLWQVDDDDGVEPVCSKLDGRNGRERWSRTDCGEHVAIDPSGDVVAAYATTLRLLASASGADVWRTDVAVGAHRLRVGSDGAIAVADETDVLLLDAAGVPRWRYRLDAPPPVTGGIRDVVLDAGGDVIVAGATTFVPNEGTDAVIARLAGADGRERWRTVLDGTNDLDQDQAVAAAFGRRGAVIVAARLNDGPSLGPVVLGLDGLTGAVRWSRSPRGRSFPRALAVHPRGAIAVGGGGTAPGHEDDLLPATFQVLRLAGRAIGSVRVY